MSKQALLLIVDVGHSMDDPFSENATRAKIALQCCKLTLQQKIFNNSSHEIGLVLFGDNDSDDGNSLLLQELAKPSIDFVRKIEQLSHARFDNTAAGGDIFSALNYAANTLQNHCGRKKYNKRLFLFTNGMGETAFTSSELAPLARKLEAQQIKLNIIPIDFMVSYDPQMNQLEGEILLQKAQQTNAQMLMSLKALTEEYVQIFPASLAIELYRRFRKKDTNPVSRYKGTLEFAPGLEIDVNTYKAIRRQRLKSLARYDASVPFEPLIPKEKEVIIQTNYVVQGDETGKIVDKENIISAFSYGPQLVPISPILEAGTKIFEDKNMRLLGFIDKARVPRHSLIGDVDIVIPGDNPTARKLFSAFIYSMISLNKYGLARYVPRNCKNGIVPKMVVLIPYRTAEREMFYLTQLPTVQDVREYPFNPLKQSSQQQKDIVRRLIKRMMLFNDEEQLVKVENTFNPQRQYFYQCVFYRALNNDDENIPPLDPVIKNYLTPQQQFYKQTKDVIPDVKKQFRLVKKLNLAAKLAKKTLVWKDIVQELSQVQGDSKLMKQQSTEEQFVKPDNKFMFEDQQQEVAFNPANPVLSFKKMISYNKEDLVHSAFAHMNNYIIHKLGYSVTQQAYKHLTDCATELRNACISEQEEQYWDDWFNDMRSNNPTFYGHLKARGLGLLKGDNTEIFKVEVLHHAELEDIICDLD